MTAGTRRHRLPPPTSRSQSACSSRRGFQPQRTPAQHTHKDRIITRSHCHSCPLHTHSHAYVGSAHAVATNTHMKQRERTAEKWLEAVTPPESCCCRWLQAHSATTHTHNTGGAHESKQDGFAPRSTPPRTPARLITCAQRLRASSRLMGAPEPCAAARSWRMRQQNCSECVSRTASRRSALQSSTDAAVLAAAASDSRRYARI
eukprot:SAG25_NODE_1730_length_2434_cov_1.153253_2_plen_204_part_00